MQEFKKLGGTSGSEQEHKIALESLRLGIKYFISHLGKIGLIRIIREVVDLLEQEGYSGFPFFLDASSDYSIEEGDRSAEDIQITWKRAARMLKYVVQETLMRDRPLP